MVLIECRPLSILKSQRMISNTFIKGVNYPSIQNSFLIDDTYIRVIYDTLSPSDRLATILYSLIASTSLPSEISEWFDFKVA